MPWKTLGSYTVSIFPQQPVTILVCLCLSESVSTKPSTQPCCQADHVSCLPCFYIKKMHLQLRPCFFRSSWSHASCLSLSPVIASIQQPMAMMATYGHDTRPCNASVIESAITSSFFCSSELSASGQSQHPATSKTWQTQNIPKSTHQTSD